MIGDAEGCDDYDEHDDHYYADGDDDYDDGDSDGDACL